MWLNRELFLRSYTVTALLSFSAFTLLVACKNRPRNNLLCVGWDSLSHLQQWRIKNFEKRGDNLSVPSSFIANALNELYAFYTEKGSFLKKESEPIGGGAPPPPP